MNVSTPKPCPNRRKRKRNDERYYLVKDFVKVLVEKTINPTWPNDDIIEFLARLGGSSYQFEDDGISISGPCPAHGAAHPYGL
jgi:hypothetical protein